jgi:hypothetical protein
VSDARADFRPGRAGICSTVRAEGPGQYLELLDHVLTAAAWSTSSRKREAARGTTRAASMNHQIPQSFENGVHS